MFSKCYDKEHERIKKEAIEEHKMEIAREKDLERLSTFRKVGERFKYLDIDMVVICLEDYCVGTFYRGFYSPVITAHYRDATGNIKEHKFYPSSLPVLIAENTPKQEPK